MFFKPFNKVFLTTLCLALAVLTSSSQSKEINIGSDATQFSLELSPNPGAYKVAAIQFLPDFKDSDIGYNTHNLDRSPIVNDPCADYPLTNCPANGQCDKCPTNSSKQRLNACNDPYIIDAAKTTCREPTCQDYGWASTQGYNKICKTQSIFGGKTCYSDCEDKVTCSQIRSSLYTSIPFGKKCTPQLFEYSDLQSLPCYDACRDLNCSGYTLSCTSKPAHATSLTKCPDCEESKERYTKPGTINSVFATFKAQCPTSACKIGACEDGYVVSADGMQCVNDTCPSGFYTECETGTQGEPQYTESGKACYQCKAPGTKCVEQGFYDKAYWDSKKPTDGETYNFVTISVCSEDSNYYTGYWVVASCYKPKPGYFLYSDLTCSSQLFSQKTLIGIIFSNPEVTSRELAVSLKSYATTSWSSTAFDIPNLSNQTSALDDSNGKDDTYTAYNYCQANSKTCSALGNAYNHTTEGTSVGDWYLPSGGELEWLMGSIDKVNASLAEANADSLYNVTYWTANEYSNTQVWGWNNNTKKWENIFKVSKYTPRPILDLEKIGKNPICIAKSCSDHTLSTCPAHGVCSVCSEISSDCSVSPSKYKLVGCNSGYEMYNGECISSCAAKNCEGYTLDSCPVNADCDECTIRFSNCTNGATKYKFSKCKDGYHQAMFGNSCVKDCEVKTCSSDYNLAVCPSSANCSSCQNSTYDCKTSYSYKITSCKSGYHLFNGNCVADCEVETCEGYTLLKCPTLTSYCKSCTTSTSSCITLKRYMAYACRPGYHLVDGVCEKNCTAETCSGYTLSYCPTGANCSSCTPKGTDCTTGALKYKIDSCKDGYKLSGSTCVIGCTDPQPGYFLYSDMSCSKSLISGRTLIGIFFSDPAYTDRKLAVSLRSLSGVWSTTGFDIPNLPNRTEYSIDDNGKDDTKIAYSYCKVNSKDCPAIINTYEYTTSGTKSGDWYLPSGQELEWLVNAKTKVNASLATAKGDPLPGGIIWTSNEFSTGNVWGYYLNQAKWETAYKGNGYSPRPILDIDKKGVSPSCAAKSCSATTYPLTSCPANGVCSTCVGQSSNCSQWATKYKLDSCKSGYVMSNGTCVVQPQKCTNPQVGYILYSDKSCSSTLTSGKTPIAVIADTSQKIAVALRNLSSSQWYSRSDDAGISSDLAGLGSGGKADTATLVKNCSPCAAARNAYYYTTSGTSSGDWYLPSKFELDAIYNNSSTINSGVSKASGTQISTSTISWSSSRSDYDIIWARGSASYELDMRESHNVRPVLNYQDWVNK